MAQERSDRLTMEELIYYEDIGDKYGWVSPVTDEEMEYIAHLRSVYKRMGINPSKAAEDRLSAAIRRAKRPLPIAGERSLYIWGGKNIRIRG